MRGDDGRASGQYQHWACGPPSGDRGYYRRAELSRVVEEELEEEKEEGLERAKEKDGVEEKELSVA